MASRRQWTSVSTPYVSGEPTDAWSVEAKAAGGKGTQKLLLVSEQPAPPHVAEALRVDLGTPVVTRARVMLLDDQPVELVDSHYPASIARSTPLAEMQKIRGGAVAHLATLGYPPRKAIEDVIARLATETDADAFNLSLPASVVEIARIILTDGDLPVEASFMTSPADRRRLHYEITV